MSCYYSKTENDHGSYSTVQEIFIESCDVGSFRPVQGFELGALDLSLLWGVWSGRRLTTPSFFNIYTEKAGCGLGYSFVESSASLVPSCKPYMLNFQCTNWEGLVY